EFVGVGNDRQDGTLSERTVTDFAAVKTTDTTGFTNAERREVVVQHEALAVFATGVVVDELCFVSRSQRSDREGLSFPTSEQGRTVCAWQKIDLAGKRTNGLGIATVTTHTFFHD